MEKENNLTWMIQMLHEHNPSLLKELEQDAKNDIEKELKNDKNIFLFHSNPFEVLDTSKHQEIFLDLKKAVNFQEYRNIYYFYQTKVIYTNVKCLKLIYAQDNWYIGVETEEEKFELLRISFIESVIYSNSKKNYNKSVINKYRTYFMRFENAMSLANIKPQKAILRASENVAMYFEKDMKKFYKSQKFIKKFDDGSIEFSINYTQPLEVLPFVKRWILEVRLLSPNSLKKILLKELEESISTLLIE
jgi:predicted DNA-binding transcriptional regulator YafY